MLIVVHPHLEYTNKETQDLLAQRIEQENGPILVIECDSCGVISDYYDETIFEVLQYKNYKKIVTKWHSNFGWFVRFQNEIPEDELLFFFKKMKDHKIKNSKDLDLDDFISKKVFDYLGAEELDSVLKVFHNANREYSNNLESGSIFIGGSTQACLAELRLLMSLNNKEYTVDYEYTYSG